MEKREYQWLQNKGFRIIRIKNDKIEMRTRKGTWVMINNYSDERWTELLNDNYILKDY